MGTDRRAFHGFRFPAEVVLWAVRQHARFPVSYRGLKLMCHLNLLVLRPGLVQAAGGEERAWHKPLREKSA